MCIVRSATIVFLAATPGTPPCTFLAYPPAPFLDPPLHLFRRSRHDLVMPLAAWRTNPLQYLSNLEMAGRQVFRPGKYFPDCPPCSGNARERTASQW